MLRSVLAFVLATVQPWIVLSDLHFDPFTQPHIVDRLAAAPPDRWRAIFEAADVGGPSARGNDTNDALLELTLDGARSAVPDPRVVVIAGDLLAHDFRAKFARTAKVHDDAAYDAFVDKSVAFLAWELAAAFPRARLLPVIGNNDSYCGDYQSTPHDAFLAHMAAAWAASVGASDPNAFIAQFSTGGYYSVPLPVDHAQAIVLNDVFWSAKYRNACGDPKAIGRRRTAVAAVDASGASGRYARVGDRAHSTRRRRLRDAACARGLRAGSVPRRPFQRCVSDGARLELDRRHVHRRTHAHG